MQPSWTASGGGSTARRYCTWSAATDARGTGLWGGRARYRGANSELMPLLFQHQGAAKDVRHFRSELLSRELPLEAERMVMHCFCMDAATTVALSGLAGEGAQAETRLFEAGAVLGVPRSWLQQVLDLAAEERALAWEKYKVLEGDPH
jgi:hypothetical protein